MTSGHFLAEENPRDTLAALLPFLKAHGVPRTANLASRSYGVGRGLG